jgi:hypothetical protein
MKGMRNHLLVNVSRLMTQDNPLLDLLVVCHDGKMLWSQLLLAANSPFLAKALLDATQAEEEALLLLPDINIATAKSMLECTVNPAVNSDILSVNEMEVVKLLRFEPPLPAAATEERVQFRCLHKGCEQLQFHRKLHYQRHVAAHTKDSQFVCDQCGKVFYHEDNLELHLKYHEDVARITVCPHCRQDCRGHRALACHIDTHHTNRLECPFCHKLLKKRLLPRHMRSKHPGEAHRRRRRARRVPPSSDGNRVVPSQQPASHPDDSIKEAVQDLIDSQQNRTKCETCDKTFSNVYTAKHHALRVHLGEQPKRLLSCSICDKKFGGPPSRLARHIREVHTENRFECNECGHFFPVKASLERHSKTVHQPKKVECPYCPVIVVHLPAHLTTAHGIEPSAARTMATELSGKSAARTRVTLDMI